MSQELLGTLGIVELEPAEATLAAGGILASPEYFVRASGGARCMWG